MERDTFAGALQRRWWIVLIAVVLGGLAGAAPSPKRAADSVSTYSASHTLLLSSNDPSGLVASDTINVNQIVLLATNGDVPQKAAAILGDSNASELASQVSVNLDGATNSLTISTNQSTPERAVKVADTFADVLTSYLATRQDDLREQRLEAALSRLQVLETEIDTLSKQVAASPDDRLVKAKVDAASRRYGIVFEQYDALQGQATSINLVTLQSAQAVGVRSEGLQAPGSRRSRGTFGMLAGAAIGLGAVLVLNFFDRRIRRRAQAEAIFGVPVQLTIPVARRSADRGVVVKRERHDRVSDTYRAMRSVLALAHNDRADKSRAPITLVLSSGPGDGKTTASANIAAAFAEAGSKTVVINTDFRRPMLSKLLGVHAPATPATPPEALEGMPLRLSPVIRGLRVHDERLTDRESTPGDLARKVAAKLPWFTATYEEVVIDSPPVSLAAEVLELLAFADAIVVMVRLGHTRIDSAAKTAETLRALGINHFFLAVIGGATDRGGGSYYSYGYSRGYTQTSPKRGRSAPTAEADDDRVEAF